MCVDLMFQFKLAMSLMKLVFNMESWEACMVMLMVCAGLMFQFKLAMSLMKLAFNMESWEACGGGPELTGPAAIVEGNKYIDRALKIFMEVCFQHNTALEFECVAFPAVMISSICLCHFCVGTFHYKIIVYEHSSGKDF